MMRNLHAAIVFYALNVLLFPITLLGYGIWVGKLILAGRRSGVSGTAQGPLSARWFMHNLGTRQDEAANRLLLAVPAASPLGIHLSAWPMLYAHRLTGYVPSAFRYPFEGEVAMQYEASARQWFFDQAVEHSLDKISQLVLLGAGFDTRAYQLPKPSQVRAFEVDTPQTQAIKRKILAKVGIDASHVSFVPADFERDDWLQQLIQAGFDRSQATLFLWEGVIVYLERAAVEETLRKVAQCGKGSRLAFDYFTSEPLQSPAPYWRYARASMQAAGEPLKFGIDSTPPSRERVAELLRRCGLTLAEQQTWGKETNGKRAWGGFAVAVVE